MRSLSESREHLEQGLSHQLIDTVAEPRRAGVVYRKDYSGGVDREIHMRAVLEKLPPFRFIAARGVFGHWTLWGGFECMAVHSYRNQKSLSRLVLLIDLAAIHRFRRS